METPSFGGLISPVDFCYLLRPSRFLKDLLCLLEFCVWWKCSSASKFEKCRFQTYLVLFWVRSHAIGLHCSTWCLLICWDQNWSECSSMEHLSWNSLNREPRQDLGLLPKGAFPPLFAGAKGTSFCTHKFLAHLYLPVRNIGVLNLHFSPEATARQNRLWLVQL